MTKGLPNRELIVFAVYLLGGDTRPVHTEDVALKCFELLPTAFSWVKYPQYPDKDIARVGLTDARKKQFGCLVEGRAGQGRGQTAKTRRSATTDGWILTPAGVSWVTQNLSRLEGITEARQPKEHRQKLRKQIGRVRDHKLFARYLDSRTGFAPTLGELADLLRCRVDAEPDVWGDRFRNIEQQALAADQPDVLDFIRKCRGAHELS